MYKWHFEIIKDNPNINEIVFEEIRNVFLNGFGVKNGWSIEEIKKTLFKSTILGLLIGKNTKVSGYVIYNLPQEHFREKYMLWTDSMCMIKSLQGKGLSKLALKQVVLFLQKEKKYQNFPIGWMAGRTQNPIIINRYSKFGKLFPFDMLYEKGEGKELMQFLLKNIEEVKSVEKITLFNGICHKVYSSGKLGDYPIKIENTSNYENKLRKWCFNRSAGDAIIVVVKLDKESL